MRSRTLKNLRDVIMPAMNGSKKVIVLGIIIGVAIVASIAAIFYQSLTGIETDNNQPTDQRQAETGKLHAGDIITLSDGQKAIAFPLVEGFYKGKTLLFIHTDASDPDVASMMTMMVNYTTQYSPKIANIQDEALAKVYVFQNGVKGVNPFGFQSDIFDSIPTDGSYSPLRKVVFVEWNEGVEPRELKSVEELTIAQSNGDLTVTETNKVVIMPLIQWDRTVGTSDDKDGDSEMSDSMQAMG